MNQGNQYAVRRKDGSVIGITGKVTGIEQGGKKATIILAGVHNGEAFIARYEGEIIMSYDQRDGQYFNAESMAMRVVFREE